MKKILLIDNFDSFTFNLVDYFYQADCDVQVFRNNVDPQIVTEQDPDLIVFSPGPSIPSNAGNMNKIIEQYKADYPMFGVCLGHEAFIEVFGGSLRLNPPAHGRASQIQHDSKTIFTDLDRDFAAGRYHSLVGDQIPDCFEQSATCIDQDGETVLNMAIRHKELPIEGVQFHPESVLTMQGGNGLKLIKNVVNYLAR